MNRVHLSALIVAAFLSVSLTHGIAAVAPNAEYNLRFDPGKFTVKSLALNGKTISFRAYENIVYVKNPVDPRFQSMNIYVPAEYSEGKPIGAYTADTAPIFLPNTVGGYMPGPAGSPGQGFDGGPNAALVALSQGYVVAEPGVRGRTNVDEAGRYTGKAPACIVDLKAAVRYLRLNEKAMPGNAQKIISNGTSAGGALSVLLGATGNNADYEPYLKALGAAEAPDDIFAVSAYCPISNLDYADMAYEWLFNGINDFSKPVFRGPPPSAGPGPGPGVMGAPDAAGAMPPGSPGKLPTATGSMTPDQVKNSALLKALFPAYLNSLELKKLDGSALSLDANGTGSFKDYVKSFVIASAQKALGGGADLSSLGWITIKDGIVTDIDFDQYVKYATRMKVTPAFDGLDLGTGENDLFGTATVKAQHFTPFGKDHSTAGGALAQVPIVKMMNPMNYIGTTGTSVAPYWRIRHGTADRDTSLAIPVILATKLANCGYNVDFALPWARPHSGDYDLDELFAWMAQVCR